MYQRGETQYHFNYIFAALRVTKVVVDCIFCNQQPVLVMKK